ncbi:unnamed protein product [Lampetra fluviatilis]
MGCQVPGSTQKYAAVLLNGRMDRGAQPGKQLGHPVNDDRRGADIGEPGARGRGGSSGTWMGPETRRGVSTAPGVEAVAGADSCAPAISSHLLPL